MTQPQKNKIRLLCAMLLAVSLPVIGMMLAAFAWFGRLGQSQIFFMWLWIFISHIALLFSHEFHGISFLQ